MVRTSVLAFFLLASMSPGQQPEPELEALVKQLKSPKAKDRVEAAEALGKLGEKAKPVARDLCRALLDPSPQVREKAGEAVKSVEPKLHPHLATIVGGTDTAINPNITARFKAREAIAELGAEGKAAVPVLCHYLQANVLALERDLRRPGVPFSRNTEEAMAVRDIQTLVKIAPEEPATIQVIGKVGGRAPGPKIAQAAIEALSEIGSKHPALRKQIWPHLLGQLGRSNSRTSAALAALRGLGEDAKQALPALRVMAQRSPKPEVRAAAAAAIRHLGGE